MAQSSAAEVPAAQNTLNAATPITTSSASSEVLESKPAVAAQPAPPAAQPATAPQQAPAQKPVSLNTANGDSGKESVVENPWEFILVSAAFIGVVLVIMFTGDN